VFSVWGVTAESFDLKSKKYNVSTLAVIPFVDNTSSNLGPTVQNLAEETIKRDIRRFTVTPSFKMRTIINENKLFVGSDGGGTGRHGYLWEEARAMHEMGIPATDVPFDGGGPAVTALLGNQVDVASVSLLEASQYLESGDFVPLGLAVGAYLLTGVVGAVAVLNAAAPWIRSVVPPMMW